MFGEMGDTLMALVLVTRATSKPDAETSRPHIRHRFREETEATGEDVANDHVGKIALAAPGI
jgi:hypothetical protein